MSFLSHHFCLNFIIGDSRDFQFKTPDNIINEIKIPNGGGLFFFGLQHAAPKRASVKKGEVRYSLSFRNIKYCSQKNVKHEGYKYSNHYYYCRGIEGAIENLYPDQLKASHLDIKKNYDRQLAEGKITPEEFIIAVKGIESNYF